jgi:cyclophilin family peptidyl-prolyl cis-trans isomerase
MMATMVVHQRFTSTNSNMSMSVSTGGSSYDNDDEAFADDMSSSCSPKRVPVPLPLQQQQQQQRTNFYGRSSSSVASEPCLPLHHHNHWSSSSQSYEYAANDPPESSRSTFVFTARKRKNPIYIMVAAFFVLGMFMYSQSHATLHDALEQVLRLTEHRRKVRAQFSNVEQDIRRLRRQMMTLSSEAAAAANSDTTTTTTARSSNKERPTSSSSSSVGVDEISTLQEKLKDGSVQISALQKHLQEISKNDAMLKYGSGKIRVELELEFPGVSHQNHHLKEEKGPNTIVMEMAPLDKMPHSVYMFLEMVDAKLFDGCSFILNAMHVIKAAPLPYDGSSAAAKVRSFSQKGLDSVAFREYSADFPHDQYTVAFAADESPSFYINTQDNSDIHIGEPCFAKIISGVETVQRMEQAPTRNGIWYRQRIGIKRAFIL